MKERSAVRIVRIDRAARDPIPEADP